MDIMTMSDNIDTVIYIFIKHILYKIGFINNI